MTTLTGSPLDWLRDAARRLDPVLTAIGLLLLTLALYDQRQAVMSLGFARDQLLALAPLLGLAVGMAAAIKASSADTLVSRVLSGHQGRTIVIAAMVGALSPLCSCGVIPLIAGLLAAGAPLAPVMAFWLSSPVMDPAMFVLTVGTLGFEFAVVKTVAAVLLGTGGGWVVLLLGRSAIVHSPLKRAPTCRGRGGATEVDWRIWRDPVRRRHFADEFASTGWMLLRWMSLAFVLESLFLAYVPATTVVTMLGSDSATAIPLAVLVGIPAYVNGAAALPLVQGLVATGMSPAAGLAFLVAGGVTSIPAAMAVWGVVRGRVFALYLALALVGASATAYTYAAWLRVTSG
jgi:uncharacterized membrane protein YraQ (UPF0718 family)